MFTFGKKDLFLILFTLAMPLMFFGCNKKVQTGACKADSDCRVDASGKAANGICHEGQCQECREDTDCSGLKQCVNNRCESSCQADADCGANTHCEDSICVADCSDNTACAGDRVCAKGRCVAELNINGEKVVLSRDECKNIEKIHFDFDQFTIKSEYRSNVQKLASCLEAYPELSVTIKGHTDEKGTPAYNMVLGEKRAGAVVGFLKNMGIAITRIKTISFGEKQPLTSESNEQAWYQNRRAEFDLR